jgi:hypothetical protein
VKRKEFIKKTSIVSAGIVLLDDALAALKSLESESKKIKNINPLATQNTIVVLLGGGHRWETESTGIKNSIYQSFTRSVMPNLFQPSQIGIRDIEGQLKQTLNQKILSSPLESTGKFILRQSEHINHCDAALSILGLNSQNAITNTNGVFTVSETSEFFNQWIAKAKRKEKLYYHHDLAGNSRKIRGTNEQVDNSIKQILIQNVSNQRIIADSTLSEPLPMFKDALGFIQEFKPKFSVLHPRLLDVAHSDFKQSLINMNRLDYSIAWLYSQLQTLNPSFALNTNWIILPDHGRDYKPNGRNDKFGSFDHKTSDSKNTWMLVNGPKIKAASGIQDLLPFISKSENRKQYFSNEDVFKTIASLTK